jgi:hypothetical protein
MGLTVGKVGAGGRGWLGTEEDDDNDIFSSTRRETSQQKLIWGSGAEVFE